MSTSQMSFLIPDSSATCIESLNTPGSKASCLTFNSPFEQNQKMSSDKQKKQKSRKAKNQRDKRLRDSQKKASRVKSADQTSSSVTIQTSSSVTIGRIIRPTGQYVLYCSYDCLIFHYISSAHCSLSLL